MKSFRRIVLAAMIVAGGAAGFSATANADARVGISFGIGFPGYASLAPCDYYDYYSAAPPWGLPPNYCDYYVYREPLFWGGTWYRGPIYYRTYHGYRQFWLNGGWRRAEWHRRPPHYVNWRTHRGWRNDWRARRDRHLHNARHDRRVHNRREIRHDRRALRQGRHELRNDRRAVRNQRHELRRDRRHNASAREIRRDRRHVRNAQHERRSDRRDQRRDRRELRRDRNHPH